MLSSPSFASSSASSSRQPWPPLLRLLTALLLCGLLSLFLSAPTLAQARRSAPTKAAPAGGAGYRTGIGLRAGGPSGVTLKHFFKSQVAVEGIVGTNLGRSGFNLTVLVEKHGPAFQSRGLQWYYGLGGHVNSYTGRDYYEWYYDRKGRRRYFDDDYYYYRDRRFWGLGIDGVLGLEYLFTDLPFTLGVDAKPFVELARRDAYLGLEGAVSLRYAF